MRNLFGIMLLRVLFILALANVGCEEAPEPAQEFDAKLEWIQVDDLPLVPTTTASLTAEVGRELTLSYALVNETLETVLGFGTYSDGQPINAHIYTVVRGSELGNLSFETQLFFPHYVKDNAEVAVVLFDLTDPVVQLPIDTVTISVVGGFDGGGSPAFVERAMFGYRHENFESILPGAPVAIAPNASTRFELRKDIFLYSSIIQPHFSGDLQPAGQYEVITTTPEFIFDYDPDKFEIPPAGGVIQGGSQGPGRYELRVYVQAKPAAAQGDIARLRIIWKNFGLPSDTVDWVFQVQ